MIFGQIEKKKNRFNLPVISFCQKMVNGPVGQCGQRALDHVVMEWSRESELAQPLRPHLVEKPVEGRQRKSRPARLGTAVSATFDYLLNELCDP
jgi:hypothetical protein